MPAKLSTSTSDMRRGSIVLVPFPNSDLRTSKIRPALIIQSNEIDSELPQVIIAMISSNLRRARRKPRILIETKSVTGKASGLLFDSVVMTDNLATILQTEIVRTIGHMSSMGDVDDALRHSLAL